MTTPTKGAFVGTGQGRCAFHTPVGIDAIEGVFVALALTQHGALGPTTLFNGTVATHQPVALLLQELPSIRGDHHRILRDLCGRHGRLHGDGVIRGIGRGQQID
jgi:hypothetical protein